MLLIYKYIIFEHAYILQTETVLIYIKSLLPKVSKKGGELRILETVRQGQMRKSVRLASNLNQSKIGRVLLQSLA